MKNLFYRTTFNRIISALLTAIFFCSGCEKEGEVVDASLFIGTWNLVSKSTDQSSDNLGQCEKKSKLVLYWYDKENTVPIAKIIDFSALEGACDIQEEKNATWFAGHEMNKDNVPVVSVYLSFSSNDKSFRWDMKREGEYLVTAMNETVDGIPHSIVRYYKRI